MLILHCITSSGPFAFTGMSQKNSTKTTWGELLHAMTHSITSAYICLRCYFNSLGNKAPFLTEARVLSCYQEEIHCSAGKQLYLCIEVVPFSLPEAATYNVWDGSEHLLSCTWDNEWKLCIKIIHSYYLCSIYLPGCVLHGHTSFSCSHSFRPSGKPAHLTTAVTVSQWFCIPLFLFLCKFKTLIALSYCLLVWMELFWLSLTHPLFLHCLQSSPSVFPLKAFWRMDFVLCEETNAFRAL